jgi:23S rRNA pseudouridine1911/1915/1917 synthase
MLDFIVPNITSPMMLRDFLRNRNNLSLSLWRKIKHTGIIEINGLSAQPGSLVRPGDQIQLFWPQECLIQPVDLPLTIYYEDDTVLIADKPAGMLVHPSCNNNTTTLANAVIYHYRSHNCQAGFHPIHRLDRNTSGLILVAKTPHAQHLLCERNLFLTRRYRSIVAGILEPALGTINKPIGRRPGSIIERIVCSNGQQAITTYQTVSNFRNASLLELELHTGRTHQIRVHLSYLGHPLLGDDLYGGSTYLIKRQALHSMYLEFIHPDTKKKMSFSTDLPDDMRILLEDLRNGTKQQ